MREKLLMNINGKSGIKRGKNYEIAPKATGDKNETALWARIIKKPDCSTGPHACPFAHSLAPLTPSLMGL